MLKNTFFYNGVFFIIIIIITKAPTSEISKGKVRRRTDHEGPVGEEKNNSTLSLTSSLDEGGK